MAESWIQLPVDGVGKKTRAITQTTSSDTVYNSTVSIVDPSNTANVAQITQQGYLYTANQIDVSFSGLLTNPGDAFVVGTSAGYATIVWQLNGPLNGTIAFEKTLDGTNYQAQPMWSSTINGGDSVTATTITGMFSGAAAANLQSRVRAVAQAGGTVTAIAFLAVGERGVTIRDQLPSGTNLIGSISAFQGVSSNLKSTVFQGSSPWIIQGSQSTSSTTAVSIAPATAGPYACFGYYIAGVTMNGTYNNLNAIFEGSDDGGNNWYTLEGARTDTQVIETGPSSLSSTNRMWEISLGPSILFRTRVLSLGNGSVNINTSFGSLPYEPSPIVAGTVTSQVVSMFPPRQSTTAILFQNILNTTLSALTAGPYNVAGYNAGLVTISGQYTGLIGVFEASDDANDWYKIQGYRTDGLDIGYGPVLLANAASSFTGNFAYQIPLGAFNWFRYRNMSILSGTAFVGFVAETLAQTPGVVVGQLNPSLLRGTVTAYTAGAVTVSGGAATAAAYGTGQPVVMAGLVVSAFPKGVTGANNFVVNALRVDPFGRVITTPNEERWHVIQSFTAITTTAESIFMPSIRTLSGAVSGTIYGGDLTGYLGSQANDFPNFIDLTEISITNLMPFSIRFEIRAMPVSSVQFSCWVPASGQYDRSFTTPLRQAANRWNPWTISANGDNNATCNYNVFAQGIPNR